MTIRIKKDTAIPLPLRSPLDTRLMAAEMPMVAPNTEVIHRQSG